MIEHSYHDTPLPSEQRAKQAAAEYKARRLGGEAAQILSLQDEIEKLRRKAEDERAKRKQEGDDDE